MLLQKNLKASGAVALKQALSVADLGDTTEAAAPAAFAGATQLEETAGFSSADPLINGTAKIGTAVRAHGLANELRHLNFEKVRVPAETNMCIICYPPTKSCLTGAIARL